MAQVVALAVLATVAALAYARALDGGFELDDFRGVVNRVDLKDLGLFVRSVLLPEYFAVGRPITDLTFALDYRIFGLSAPAFHRTGVVLHLAATVLGYLVVRRIARRAGWPGTGLALFTAGVFALHPMQTQAVSYISQRAEVLASLFSLAAVLLLLEADDRGLRRRGAAAWAAAFAAFAVAVGAKVIAVTVPATYLLVGVCFPPEGAGAPARSPRRRLLLIAPFVALSTIIAVRQTTVLDGNEGAGFNMPGLGWGVYFLTQWRVVLTYLRLLAWPSDQNIDHEFALSRGLLEPPSTLLAGLALAALAAGAIGLVVIARRRTGPGAAAARLAGFGFLWFLVFLGPTSSVVPLADMIEEHRVYLASIGIALAAGAGAAWALGRLAGPRAPAAAAAASVVVLGGLAVALQARNVLWSSSEALWADAAAKSPTKARPHLNYGWELRRAGKPREALAEYRQALLHASDGTVRRGKAVGEMAPILFDMGRADEAIDLLRRALREAPDDPEVEQNLALCYLKTGDLTRAGELARDAVRRWPKDPDAHNILGVILLREGNDRGALEQFRKALAFGPNTASAARNLAVVAERLGMIPDACAAWAHLAELSGSGAGFALARERIAAMRCR